MFNFKCLIGFIFSSPYLLYLVWLIPLCGYIIFFFVKFNPALRIWKSVNHYTVVPTLICLAPLSLSDGNFSELKFNSIQLDLTKKLYTSTFNV